MKVRYKQTLLGVLWVIILPLIAAGIFSFVFGAVADFPTPGDVPYFLFALSGLLAWNLFANTLTRSTDSLVSNSHLASKVYFPRLILPTSAVFSAFVDFCLACVLFGVLAALEGQGPGWRVLLAPAVVVLLLLLALGVGFVASGLAVTYRDVRHILPVGVQFLLYASPVAYPVAKVIEELPPALEAVFRANPLVGLLEAFRWSVLGVGNVAWGWFGYSAAVCVVVFIAGIVLFRRMERSFADVI